MYKIEKTLSGKYQELNQGLSQIYFDVYKPYKHHNEKDIPWASLHT